jgi:AraC family transcriptional regulator, regulatory protein of adaptative response / DNA-3-methyladenine glycosylase II
MGVPTVVTSRTYRVPGSIDLIAFLAARAIPGVEAVEDGSYRRTLELAHAPAVVTLAPAGDDVRCELQVEDRRDLNAAEARCRRLLDLDADVAAAAAHLERDMLLRPLVRRRPGLRVPGCVDGFELAVRAVVGQQVSVPAARTVLGRLVERYGGVPSPDELAEADPAAFPFPRTRGQALVELARMTAARELSLDAGADPAEARRLLTSIPGIGPWTAGYVAMRALGDRDVFLPGDVGVQHALARLGGRPDHERWRPFRSYAVMHLWRSLDG